MPQERPTPAQEAERLYGQAEGATAEAMEDLVSRDAFGAVLARVTENVMALTKMSGTAFDLVLRNLRVAGRQDLVRLGRQLARTEDKLELVLQELERVSDRIDAIQDSQRDGRGPAAAERHGGGRSPAGAKRQRAEG